MPWKKSVQEGVEDDDGRRQVHRYRCVHAGNRVEQCSAGLDARRRIDGVCKEEDDCADDLKSLGLRKEAVGQILRDRDRVLRLDGEGTEARSLNDPADGVTDRKSDGDPHLAHAESVNGSGQTHQNPCAHVRRAGRKSRDPCAHLAVTEEVTLVAAVVSAEEKPYADQQHKEDIDDKNDHFNICHDCTSKIK